MSIHKLAYVLAAVFVLSGCSTQMEEGFMTQRLIETSTLLYSIDTQDSSQTIDSILSHLDQTFTPNAQAAGLKNVRLATEPSRHWMTVAFVFGGARDAWKMGVQLHRSPDITGTRVYVTLRYAETNDSLADRNLGDLVNILQGALSKSL